jgi:hypothetical protein
MNLTEYVNGLLLLHSSGIMLITDVQARENSVHSQPDPEEQAPSKHVSVLVCISDFGKEPQIRFLADPWDLFEDGQLILENTRKYQARLNLRLRQPAEGAGNGEVGFDSVQIRQHRDHNNDDARQEGEKEKSTKKSSEIGEAGSDVSIRRGIEVAEEAKDSAIVPTGTSP